MANKYKYTKTAIAKRRKWAESLKNKPCKRCHNRFHSCAMEWHHRDSKTKKFSVGRGLYRNSKKLILKEIKKCDLYCSNCHAIIGYEIRNNVKIPLDYGK